MTHKTLTIIAIALPKKKRRGVAEVISTLLLVVITVVGAVILTGFLDESFVSGSLSVTSGTETPIKTVKLRAYDTRDGTGLMDNPDLNNSYDDKLCRASCAADTIPSLGGTEFMVIQIVNQGVKTIYLKNIYLDTVNYPWDPLTQNKKFDPTQAYISGIYPADGRFSIIPEEMSFSQPTQLKNQINGGQTVNVVIKLDNTNPDLELGKTRQVQLNIGENSLAEFLIETGDAR